MAISEMKWKGWRCLPSEGRPAIH